MTWLNPWAWLGLGMLALPVLVHLLARRRAPLRLFPTLRFLEPTPPSAVRRMRLDDPLLLALRLLVLGMAVTALAGPLRSGPPRAGGTVPVLRVVLVDTAGLGGAMAPAGESALDAARRAAAAWSEPDGGGTAAPPPASGTRVLELHHLPEALAGAGAWLETQAGLREVVVVSSFFPGSLQTPDLAGVPPGVGVRLRRVEVERVAPPHPRSLRVGGGMEVTARVEGEEAVWRFAPASAGVSPGGMRILHGPEEEGRVGMALEAVAMAVGLPAEGVDPRMGAEVEVPPSPGVAGGMAPQAPDAGPVALVLPGHPARDALEGGSRPPDRPWMAHRLADLHREGALDTGVIPGAVGLEGEDHLLLFLDDGDPARVAGLLSALARSGRGLPPPPAPRSAGDEAPTLPPDREPSTGSAAPHPDPGGPSEARWFWAAVLLLLLGEGAARRRMAGGAGP